jgi:putative DNA primase/helicase
VKQDHYKVLGVAYDATQNEIKRAYWDLAKELHPDTNPDPDAAERMKAVTEAYGVLGDADKRREYDRQRLAVGAGPEFAPELEYPPPSAPYRVAQKLYRDHGLGDSMHNLRAWRGGWMAWRTTHWTEIDDAELKQAAYAALTKTWYWHETKTTIEQKPWSPDKHKMANVLESLAAVTHLASDIDPPAWINNTTRSALSVSPDSAAAQTISCRNGLLDLRSRTLSKHTPALFNLVSVPLEYDPDAADPIVWLEFLQSLWGVDEQSIALLQEYMGYVLSGRLDMQKLLLMIGPFRSGKGTISRTLSKLMGGRSNVAGPTLSSLGTNFGMSSLLGKPLAIISDARMGTTNQHVVVERLLSITGEDMLDVDRKFREVWTGKLPTRFVILSNELPKFRDSSTAIATRMLILRMTHSFLNKEDHELDDKLEPELGGVLLWALKGLDRLNKNGRFTVPQSSDDATALMMDLASPVSAFIRERCVLGPNEVIPRDELYEAWKTWAEENGHRAMAKSTFGRDLRAVVPEVKDYRPRDGGSQIHSYTHIALSPDSLDSPGWPSAESGTPDSASATKPQLNDGESGESATSNTASTTENYRRGESGTPDSDARRFQNPTGSGRCDVCGFHIPTQGHRDNCPAQQIGKETPSWASDSEA